MLTNTAAHAVLKKIHAALGNMNSLLPANYHSMHATVDNVKLLSPLAEVYKDMAALCSGFSPEAVEQEVAGLCIGMATAMHTLLSVCGDDVAEYVQPKYVDLQSIAAIDADCANKGMDVAFSVIDSFYPNMLHLVELAETNGDARARGICQALFTIHRAITLSHPEYEHVCKTHSDGGLVEEATVEAAQVLDNGALSDGEPLPVLFNKLVELSQSGMFSFRFIMVSDEINLQICCDKPAKLAHMVEVGRLFPDSAINVENGVISFIAPLFS